MAAPAVQYNGHITPTETRTAEYKSPEPTRITIRPGHFVVFGDNTVNSLDSRYWGDFPG